MPATILASRQIPSTTGSGITRIILNVTTTATAGAVANTDYIYICSGTFTITLPNAVGNTNRYTIKNTGSTIITIAFTSGQTADGNTTIELTRNQSVDLISNNTNYFII